MTTTENASTTAEPQLRRKKGLPGMQEGGLLVVVLLLYAFFAIASHGHPSPGVWNPFLSWDNQVNGISRKLAVYAILATGMTCVIITGGIDISVGAILALAELVTGMVLQRMAPDSPWYVVLPVAFLVPVAVGSLCGAANGGIKILCRMHPFIVTLATLSIFRGMCVLYFPPNVPTLGNKMPTVYSAFMRYEPFLGLQVVPLIIMLVVIVAGTIFLKMTVAGRETYAVGGNLEAARFSGIRTWWVLMRVYIIMGVCCGAAAMVELGRWGVAATNAGEGYELTVIAAAVVGGASLTGGRGTALGALLGTLVIASLENGIMTMQWNVYYTKIIIGCSIILAVVVDNLSAHYFRGGKRGA